MERTKAAAAAKARAAAAAKSETDRLARMLLLFNGAESVFIGSDRKCAQQFVETSLMEGLEKRKRIAELVSFGCGFLTKSRTHVSVAQSNGAYSLVSIEEGDQRGKDGWVANSWLQPAAITR